MFGLFGSKSAKSLSPAEARELVHGGRAVLVDVREQNEWASGHIEGAIHAPLSHFADAAAGLPRDTKVILYCLSGVRSQRALQLCKRLGLPIDTHMAGGIAGWKALGWPVVR